MSSVTSGIISSAAQAGAQSREISATRSAERKAQETGGQRTGPGVSETGEVVTTSDNDTQIFADSEGLGSQGREADETVDEDDTELAEDDAPPPSTGMHQDSDGQWHVDMEA